MTVQTYAQMKHDVEQGARDAKFTRDLESNMTTIRSRMASGYKQPFVVYDGNDSQRMLKTLKDLGFNATPNPGGGTMPYVQLP